MELWDVCVIQVTNHFTRSVLALFDKQTLDTIMCVENLIKTAHL